MLSLTKFSLETKSPSMLPDDTILPICQRWARILWRPNNDIDELISVAYCNLKPLPSDTKDGTLGRWAKFSILHFLEGEKDFGIKIGDKLLRDKKKKRDSIIESVVRNYKLIARSRLLQYKDQDALLELQEAVENLAPDEYELIYRYFWLGQNYREMSHDLELSLDSIHRRMKRVLGLLKREVLK